MKITADVREYASGLTENEKAALYPEAAKQGMADMSKNFLDMGAEVYVDKAAAATGRLATAWIAGSSRQ